MAEKFKIGDKVKRVKVNDKFFPIGMVAEVLAVNLDDKMVLVKLPDGTRFTASFSNIKKVTE